MTAETLKNKEAISTPAMIWRLIKAQPWSFLMHTLFTLLVFGLQVIPGLIVKYIFDTISGAAPIQADLLGVSRLVWFILLYVATELVNLIAGFGADWFGWTFRLTAAAQLASNVFASILRRKADRPLEIAPGEVINRLSFTNDAGEVGDFPTWLPDQLGKWIAAGIAVVIMARINLSITLVIFLPLIGTMLLTRLAWGKMLIYSRKASEAGDKVAGFMGEVFEAVQSIKVADSETSVARQLQALNEKRAGLELRYGLARDILEAVNSSVVSFGIGVVLLMAGAAISNGSFSVGDFALFISYLWFTTRVPSELGTFYGDYKTQEVSIDRLLEMIRPEPAVRLIDQGSTLSSHGSVEMVESAVKGSFEELAVSDLTYLHNGSQHSNDIDGRHSPVPFRGIDRVSFSIRRGEFLVITGRVGSGKSTLLRVLLGLLPRQAGDVRWNGQVLHDLDAFMRPPRVAYTSQSPRLFSESLRENLLLGLPDHPDTIRQALYQSVLEDDVAWLPLGLNTLVGPRGIRLSGGQAQRAAAARMFVRQAMLYMFDDLSSALDVQTEQLLWDRLDALRLSSLAATCLVVSHRRPALLRADRIIVMKNGRLDASGRLEDLLSANTEMQFLWNGIDQ